MAPIVAEVYGPDDTSRTGMAAQVKAILSRTAGVVDVDWYVDDPQPERVIRIERDKALIKWAELRSKGIGYLGEWISNRIAWEIEKRRYAASGDSAAPVFNNRKVELAFRAALPAYDLQPWSGPLTVFRPPLDRHWQVSVGNWVSREREYVFDDNDWTRWAPAVEVVEVPGDHDSMVLVPNVSVLAGEVKARLDAADAAALARSTAEAAE